MADQAIDGRARHRGRRNPSTAAQLRTLQTALANAALLVDRASIETFRHFFLDVTVMSCGRIRRRLPGMSDLAEELGVSVTTVYVRCARVARLITGRPAEQRPAEPRRRLVG